jgi:hypothetical protein
MVARNRFLGVDAVRGFEGARLGDLWFLKSLVCGFSKVWSVVSQNLVFNQLFNTPCSCTGNTFLGFEYGQLLSSF